MKVVNVYICAKCKQPATLNKATLGDKKKGGKTWLGLGTWVCGRCGKGVKVICTMRAIRATA